MPVQCPHCQVLLRFNARTTNARLYSFRCPVCQMKFKVRSKAAPMLEVLLAHQDKDIFRQVVERVERLKGAVTVCADATQVTENLSVDRPCALLLDVAFQGTFPFQLIEQIKTSPLRQLKVILLPSVYNKTAYKKRPDSLYGADAYLELHHIGDRLLPLLGELFPALAERASVITAVETAGDERRLGQQSLLEKATELARVLVADIVFYHQEQLEQGVLTGQWQNVLTDKLVEGRKAFYSRLPAAAGLQVDFVQQAFAEVCRTYSVTRSCY